MHDMNKEFDKKVILEVFYIFEGRGIQPGSFTEHLIGTIAKADMLNQAKLSAVFPDYVAVVSAYKNSMEDYDRMVSQAFGKD